jgi:hypothetical protein
MKKPARQLVTARGNRREAHFANGGTLHEWRGGLAHTIPNKRKEADRNACRGNFLNA